MSKNAYHRSSANRADGETMIANRKAALLAAIMLLVAGVALGGVGQVAGDHAPDHASDSDEDVEDEEEEAADGAEEEEAEEGDAADEAAEEAEEAEDEEEIDEVEAGVASIDLEIESNASEERLKASLSVADGPEFRVDHKHEVEHEEAEAEAKHRLTVTFATLLEYEDADDDGVFDADETVVSSWTMNDHVDRALAADDGGDFVFDEPVVERMTMDGEEVAKFHVNGTLTNDTLEAANATGNLSLAGAVAWDPAAENTSLKPTVAHTAVDIEDFPFVGNDTDLAIALSVSTESKTEATNATMEDHESFHVEVNDEATVDGDETDVGTTILAVDEETKEEDDEVKTEMEKDVVLAYERGEQVNHSPQLEATLR